MFDDLMNRIRLSYSTKMSENPAVTESKRQGKMVFGYMCNNFPEEILAAAGILPVKYLGSTINVLDANQYQSTFMCHYARSILELGLNEEYKSIDGQVYSYGCDGGSNLFQILMETVPTKYQRFIYVPHNREAVNAVQFYINELKSFSESLELFMGKKISDSDLKGTIIIYNKHRELLQKIYDLRGTGQTPVISGSEVAEILEYSVSVPKIQSNYMLSELIEAVPNRKVKTWAGPRLIVDGTIIDKEFYQIIESLGGMIIGDGLCLGNRYFWGKVDEDMPPLEALANYCLNRLPCNCMGSERVAEKRLEHIVNQVRKYNAHGVVLATQKWCDPVQFDRPYIMNQLQSSGIPVISIDIERTVDTSQIRNRLESFIEMIKLSEGYRKSSLEEVV